MIGLLLSLIASYRRLEVGRVKVSSGEKWTVIMLAADVIISAAMSLTRAVSAYSLVLVWAYAGIALKHANTPVVAISAWVGAGLILVISIVVVIGKYPSQKAQISA